jgi:hypothetical protein
MFILAIGITLIAARANAQSSAPTSSEPLPRFEDYPTTEVFKGPPAMPRAVTPKQRMYRGKIREGVSKGSGVVRDGKEQPGPNFAGHYIIVSWGCGLFCSMMAMVDAKTGIVYDPPICGSGCDPPTCWGSCGNTFALPLLGQAVAEVNYRVNSRLVVMKACPDQWKRPNAPCFSYYFLWQDNLWHVLAKVMLTKSEL